MQVLLSLLCMALTSAVIGNAYIQKKQFYPAVVYITKSNASMAVIYIQFFMIVFMFGKLLRKIFLGTLRAAEFEHLLERFWYALTETCLAFTVFRDDFNPRFVALFTVLLFLKSFHWLAEERVDFMERSPVLGWLFHIRVASLLFVLGVLDYLLLSYAHEATVLRGPTVQLVFGFEYAILLTVVLSTLIKYVLHSAEMRTDTPWENKAVFLLYTELVIGLIKVILYVLFVFIMAKIYALPMFVFRPMFFTIRNFKRALSDVIMSRRAIRNMNTLYPDATAEELRLSDNICIICREDMVSHSKKLPCGHIFHTTCLRSWFQRQQTCPTCRLNILRSPAANSTAIRRPEEAAAAAPAVAAGAGVPPATAQAPGAAAAATAATNNGNSDAAARPEAPLGANPFENLTAGPFANLLGAGVPPSSVMPPPPPGPFMFPPAFPFMGPHTVPPPPMPPDLTTFTEEELRAMEGNERSHIEQRIKLLRNIQTFLDAASILMTNYQIVSAQPVTSNQPEAAAAPVTPAAAAAATQSAAAPPPPPPDSPARDGPSTSAAAAAAAFAAFTLAKTSSSLLAEAGKPATATSSDSSGNKKFAVGDVTIEDLGREENEDKVVSASAAATASSSGSDVNILTIDTSDRAELRKRRLKFLEERNQSAPAAPTTTTNSTTSGESSLQ